jgi:transcriptional regulator of heat shock response
MTEENCTEQINWVDLLEELAATFTGLANQAKNVKYVNDTRMRLQRENDILNEKCHDLEEKLKKLQDSNAQLSAQCEFLTKENTKLGEALQAKLAEKQPEATVLVTTTKDGKVETKEVKLDAKAEQDLLEDLFSSCKTFIQKDPFLKICYDNLFGEDDE